MNLFHMNQPHSYNRDDPNTQNRKKNGTRKQTVYFMPELLVREDSIGISRFSLSTDSERECDPGVRLYVNSKFLLCADE